MKITILLLKASLVLATALVAARLLDRGSASARHGLWSAAFVALLALPVFRLVAPSVDVPIPSAWHVQREDAIGPRPPSPQAASGVSTVMRAAAVAVSEPAQLDGAVLASRPFPSVATLALAVWAAGAAAAVAMLLLSLVRVHRLATGCHAAATPDWHALTTALAARLGLRRQAHVVFSDRVRTPMAGGIWRPLIFLPSSADGWSADRREIVLAHELSHLARRDPLRHLAARLTLACYWFHPLAWLAARQSSLAREQACDETVLALGVRPSDYARVLLELAEGMTSPRATAALPMLERSLLERRLMAILDDRSCSTGSRPLIVLAGAALVTLAIAAAQPTVHATALAVVPDVARAPVSTAVSEPRLVRFTGGVVANSALPAAQGGAAGCWADDFRGSFRGSSVTTADDAGRSVVYDMIGTRNGDRIVQTHVGDQRLCMVAEGAVGLERGKPSEWSAPRMLIESRRGGSTQQMEIRGAQVAWRVNGAERPVDAAAREWRAAMLAVLDEAWQISSLRGDESSLRGEISSIRGRESSLRGEISSVHGEVSSMRGEQSSVRGDESSLRGEISSIEGHVSSLRGEISSERGAISSLEASRYDLADADRARLAAQITAHENEIARIERELDDYNEAAKIAAVDKQIRALDADAKVAAVERQIRAFDEAARVAAIEKQIEALDVAGRIAAIETRIQALDVDRRTRDMQKRLDEAVARLQRVLAAIK
jgi:beta-lactamase regulating signal transducer with metallopeptidase domain/predicted  nucleic acid-binding Zn-ribbon protein